ncbi:neuropilin and tolloid-like protein 1 [Tubulanus polymorphus]|uniref:neuropilin and tolloid-like protein 1 n=1 Tax=Tubulanus polymorphus TaxID=672921 RepID=UPI003DA34F82
MRIVTIMKLFSWFIIYVCNPTTSYGLQISTFLTENCNKEIPVSETGRIEVSLSLTYPDNLDCSLKIRVPPGKRIALHFRRFRVESARNGLCVDYLRVYDGPSLTSSQRLISNNDLCGDLNPLTTRSSRSEVMIHFVTDENSGTTGFEIVYVAFEEGPCKPDQFACHDNICINDTLKCDDIGQCWKLEDEGQHCTKKKEDIDWDMDNTLKVGLGTTFAGLFVTLAIAFIGYRCCIHLSHSNESKNLDKILKRTSDYPVTRKYYRPSVWSLNTELMAQNSLSSPSDASDPDAGRE